MYLSSACLSDNRTAHYSVKRDEVHKRICFILICRSFRFPSDSQASTLANPGMSTVVSVYCKGYRKKKRNKG